MKRILILVAMMICIAVTAFAQSQPETITIPKSQATQEQINAFNTQKQVQTVNTWVGLGKEVGTAMTEGLSALNTEVNKFSESPAGKFTMFIIAWKVLGRSVLQVVIGFPMWLMGTIYFMFVFYRNCVTRRIVTGVDKDTKLKTYAIVNQSGEYARSGEMTHLAGVRFAHFAAFVVFTGMMALITLA